EVQALAPEADRPDVAGARATDVEHAGGVRIGGRGPGGAVEVKRGRDDVLLVRLAGRRRPHVTFAARPDRSERPPLTEVAEVDLRPGIAGAALDQRVADGARTRAAIAGVPHGVRAGSPDVFQHRDP